MEPQRCTKTWALAKKWETHDRDLDSARVPSVAQSVHDVRKRRAPRRRARDGLTEHSEHEQQPPHVRARLKSTHKPAFALPFARESVAAARRGRRQARSSLGALTPDGARQCALPRVGRNGRGVSVRFCEVGRGRKVREGRYVGAWAEFPIDSGSYLALRSGTCSLFPPFEKMDVSCRIKV